MNTLSLEETKSVVNSAFKCIISGFELLKTVARNDEQEEGIDEILEEINSSIIKVEASNSLDELYKNIPE